MTNDKYFFEKPKADREGVLWLKSILDIFNGYLYAVKSIEGEMTSEQAEGLFINILLNNLCMFSDEHKEMVFLPVKKTIENVEGKHTVNALHLETAGGVEIDEFFDIMKVLVKGIMNLKFDYTFPNELGLLSYTKIEDAGSNTNPASDIEDLILRAMRSGK